MKKRMLCFDAVIVLFCLFALIGGGGCTGGTRVVVEYNANGGDVSTPFDATTAGSSVILPSAAFSGYIFGGWYDYNMVRVGTAGTSYVVSETITLYAQWIPSGFASYSEKYSYERGSSLYYVEYEIQYYVNDFRYDSQPAVAYFDSYASAWAFSITGGPTPTPYYEEIWIDSVNRWWVAGERPNYLVEVEDLSGEGIYTYWGPTFPGTELAPDFWPFEVGDYTARIVGVAGPSEYRYTEYDEDPGYFALHDPIRVHEWWWSTVYTGWVYGTPDVYMVRIVPTNGTIYGCR